MTRVRELIVRVNDAPASAKVRPDGSVIVEESGEAGQTAAGIMTSYLGHGRVRLDDGAHAALAYVVEDEEKRWVFVDGHVFEVEVEDASVRARRRRSAGGHESLSAPMPATVVRIPIAVGQKVTRGTALVILEAMKMELPLRAPRDAIVEAIRCIEGELVQPGTPLVDLDERPASP